MLAKLFADIAASRHDQAAIKTPLIEMTYGRLHQFSNYVANALGSHSDTGAAALLFEHGADMITASLAAMKAGRLYVPLTPTYPRKRLLAMLNHAQVRVLVTNDENLHLAQALVKESDQPIHLLNIARLERLDDADPPPQDGERPAYILYTSGSTGEPKGVVQRESSVIHFCRQYAATMNMAPGDRLSLFSTFSHDAAIVDIYSALLHGATLYPVSILKEDHLSHLADWLNHNQINLWHSVPAFFRFFMNSLEGDEVFPHLRTVVLGGEAVHLNDFVRARTLFPHTALVNLYGQSESSYNSYFRLEPGQQPDKITLGEEIKDVTLLVVNEEGEEVDPLQIGEIVVASPHVAVGYWRNPEADACFDDDEDFGRLYWTGDQGRLLLNEQIEFIARNDHRVKIRGNRVELGEVENAILAHPLVGEVLAAAFLDPRTHNHYLAAFLTAKAGYQTHDLREHLSAQIPDYMIPSYFVKMDALPRTDTGKLDRRNLPDPMANVMREMDYHAPTNAIETQLVKLWGEVLGQERLGIDDDFFELGGHSLRAMNMLSRIHQMFQVDIQLSQIFRGPTVRELAVLIKNAERRRKARIARAESRPHYPLSPSQRRLLILHEMDPDSLNYNMVFPIRMTGALDVDRLQAAFHALIARHESLRTSFHMIGETCVQKIHEQVNFAVHIGTLDRGDDQIRHFNQPFDLGEPCQMRAALFREGPNRTLFVLNIHHIITDGSSNLLLFRDLLDLYAGRELTPPSIHYRDYAVWLGGRDEEMQRQEAFWLEQFAHEPPMLTLPTDRPRPPLQRFAGASLELEISHALTSKLKDFSRANGATLFMTLLSTWYLLLHKYSDGNDIVVGSPISGRPHNDLEDMVGMFVNTMALRARFHTEMRFSQLLESVKHTALAAYEHQDYPFEALVERVIRRRDISRNPLFDTMFVLQNMERPHIHLADLDLSVYDLEESIARFDLTVMGFEREGDLNFQITYAMALYDRETMVRLAGHFNNLLEQITAQPDLRLREFNLIQESERRQILEQFQGEPMDQPPSTLTQLFAAAAARFPQKTALILGEESLTYAQLDHASSQLARALRGRGVRGGQVVTLMCGRSAAMAVGVLGILKAGAAYHPVDPAYPTARKRYMIEDMGAALLLHDGCLFEDMPAIPTALLAELSGQEVENPLPVVTAGEAAYVIYTSGTTGKPKGVMVTHHSAAHTLIARARGYDFDDTQIALQLFSFSFDGFVTGFFSPLTCGGTLVMTAEEDTRDMSRLEALMIRNRVSHMIAVPQLYKLMLDTLSDDALVTPRLVTLAGDRVAPELVRQHRERCPRAELSIEYGVTEAAVMSTIQRRQQDRAEVSIGRVAPGTRVYVMGPFQELLPVGVPGEICIGGPGVALGYHGRDGLTAERFVADPFQLGRLYRSGDRARWLPGGELQFLGRLDYQVKIRGFRIELGEIENQLMTHERVLEAVVVDKRDPAGNAYLAAYVIPADQDLDEAQLKNFLSHDLPDFMIPNFILCMAAFPLTPNGKIDKTKLPQPMPADDAYQAPKGEVEAALVQLWAEILKLEGETISRTANFFDLGGHSLSAVQLTAAVLRRFKVQVPLSILFKLSTIQALAAFIEKAETRVYRDIQPAPLADSYPLSSAQQRLFVLHQFNPRGTAYNIPIVVRFEGRLDGERFKQVLNQLAQRHQSLRTSFHQDAGAPVMRISDVVEVTLQCKQGDEAAAAAFAKDWSQPFDLAHAPLLRTCLFQTGPETYLFFLDMHHIIADAVSGGVLLREFAQLYDGQSLPGPRLHYKDYAVWQSENRERLAKQGAWWQEQFAQLPPVLELPRDFKRPAVQRFEGDVVRVDVGHDLQTRLESFSRERDLTQYMLLLGAFGILLSRYSGQEDVVVGSPVAGRPHDDLRDMVGMFVNTIAARLAPEPEMTVAAYLAQVRRTMLDAFEHQDVPFEDLIERLNLPRDTSRNPLFDTMFSLQRDESAAQTFRDFSMRPYPHQRGVSKFDLMLEAVQGKDLAFYFQYSTALFKRETVAHMARHWLRLLALIPDAADQRIADLTLADEAEQRRVLVDFNQTQMDGPGNRTLIDLFRGQVDARPHHPAVVFGGETVTFAQLEARAGEEAARLRHAGVGAGVLVALEFKRGPLMLTAMLAVLQTGAAYIPLDPNYPEQRRAYLLEDAGATLILTEQNGAIHHQGKGTPTFDGTGERKGTPTFDGVGKGTPTFDDERKGTPTASDTAYVIYTSGSTGNPKGVPMHHRGVVNLALGQAAHFGMNEHDRVLLFSSYCFDASIEQIWTAWAAGAALVLLDEAALLDADAFAAAVNHHEVTHLHAVPAFLNGLDPARFPLLKRVVAGGDVCPADLAARWCERTAFYNEYGPTETCVTAVQTRIHAVEPGCDPPIGKPVANMHALVLDRMGKPTPIGVPGELHLAGVGLATGYLNRPQLNRERFVYNPHGDGFMYRTGDLVRWNHAGELIFMGRLDHQIKLRGFRIELGEIEFHLRALSDVTDAVVSVRPLDGPAEFLAAFVQAPADRNPAELKRELAARVPEYMVPAHLVILDALPKTTAGKVDRRALDQHPVLAQIATGATPTTHLERRIATVWAETLGLNPDQVDLDTSFFDQGGHSLKATVLLARLHGVCGVRVPLVELFKTPTVRGLAVHIAGADPRLLTRLPKAPALDRYPTTHAQRRMLVLQHANPDGVYYNMPTAVQLTGALDVDALAAALTALVERHEALRTRFVVDGTQIFQIIEPHVPFSLAQISDVGRDTAALLRAFVKPFDLMRAPLFRAQLVRRTQTDHILMLDLHHIVGDGVSYAVLVRDLAVLVAGEALSPPAFQYRDAAHHLDAQPNWTADEAWWLDHLKGAPASLKLPLDQPRPANPAGRGGRVHFALSPQDSVRFEAFARQHQVTPFMLVLACYHLFLAKLSGQEDVVVGVPMAGRDHPDLEGIVGVFVNTLAVRNRAEENTAFTTFLGQVKRHVLEAAAHGAYPHDLLVEKLGRAKQPLFQTMLVVQDTDTTPVSLPGLTLTPLSVDTGTSKCDLTLYAHPGAERVSFILEYDAQLFSRDSADRFGAHLLELMAAVLENGDAALKDIGIRHRFAEPVPVDDEDDDDGDFDF